MRLFKLLLVLVTATALVAAVPQKKGAAAKKAETRAAQVQGGAPLDLNTASEQQLKQLPGIGDAYAAKIVQNRPYRAKNDLVRKKVIPQSVYDKIKDRIVARQPKKK